MADGGGAGHEGVRGLRDGVLVHAVLHGHARVVDLEGAMDVEALAGQRHPVGLALRQPHLVLLLLHVVVHDVHHDGRPALALGVVAHARPELDTRVRRRQARVLRSHETDEKRQDNERLGVGGDVAVRCGNTVSDQKR